MIKLTRIFYNGKEYRGIFCPNDIQTTDLELQVYEFGQIALNTLVADKKLDSFLNDEEKKITVSK
ncbi:hypothetical protein EQ500_06305, partial [Lactobacillus sp. XV13L]|nr:hypothetical protein [Lactobacillus sp. XV13L]